MTGIESIKKGSCLHTLLPAPSSMVSECTHSFRVRRAQFLAFKSDVEFWRRNKSLEGLSVRTLFMEVVFQVIILMSLIEEDASLLVTVPSAVGILIQVCALSFITDAMAD